MVLVLVTVTATVMMIVIVILIAIMITIVIGMSCEVQIMSIYNVTEAEMIASHKKGGNKGISLATRAQTRE